MFKKRKVTAYENIFAFVYVTFVMSPAFLFEKHTHKKKINKRGMKEIRHELWNLAHGNNHHNKVKHVIRVSSANTLLKLPKTYTYTVK